MLTLVISQVISRGCSLQSASHLGAVVWHCSARCSKHTSVEEVDAQHFFSERAWAWRDPQGGMVSTSNQTPSRSFCCPAYRRRQVLQIEDEWCAAWPCASLQKAHEGEGQVDLEVAILCQSHHPQRPTHGLQIQDQGRHPDHRSRLALPQGQDHYQPTLQGRLSSPAGKNPECPIRVLAQDPGLVACLGHSGCLAHGSVILALVEKNVKFVLPCQNWSDHLPLFIPSASGKKHSLCPALCLAQCVMS